MCAHLAGQNTAAVKEQNRHGLRWRFGRRCGRCRQIRVDLPQGICDQLAFAGLQRRRPRNVWTSSAATGSSSDPTLPVSGSRQQAEWPITMPSAPPSMWSAGAIRAPASPASSSHARREVRNGPARAGSLLAIVGVCTQPRPAAMISSRREASSMRSAACLSCRNIHSCSSTAMSCGVM